MPDAAPAAPSQSNALTSAALSLLSVFGFDQPDVLRRNLMKLAFVAMPFVNTFLASKGLPPVPDSMIELAMGGLVPMILAAEAKAAHANHLDVKAQVAATIDTPEKVVAAVTSGTPAITTAAPSGTANPADAPVKPS